MVEEPSRRDRLKKIANCASIDQSQHPSPFSLLIRLAGIAVYN